MHPKPDRQPDAPSQEFASVLARAARGDEDAWRRVVALYARRVFALAKSRVRNPDLAEEIAQSVFATVAIKLTDNIGYAEQGKFEPWLFRIAVNRIRDEIRRLRRHAEPTDPEALGHLAAPTASADPDAPELLANLRSAMERLSDADRQIIELRHHAGMSFNQIAVTLEEPLGTLLARHHRALRKLKEMMSAAPSASQPASPRRGQA